MGQEIVYCFKCLCRLTTGELERGLGLRVGNKVACTDCLPDLVASLSPEEHRSFAKDLAARQGSPRVEAPRGSSSKHQRIRPSSTRMNASSEAAARNRWLLPALAGAGGLALLGILLVANATSGGREKPPASPSVVKPPSEDPRHRAAREAVDRARKAPRGDLEAQIAAWAEAVRLSANTPSSNEASETHQALLDERAKAASKALSREMADLDAQARPLLEREEFRAALDVYERARARRDTPDWRDLINARIKEARSRADLLYAGIKPKAADARRKGALEEVKALQSRVANWQVPEFSQDLERTLAAITLERPWRPIFDGKSTDFLNPQARHSWKIQDGGLVRLEDNAGQTKEAFGDGEVRIRFESGRIDNLWFVMRQSGGEGFRIGWNTASFFPLEGKRCEIIFTCRGDMVTATLNGQPLPVEATGGRPRQGLLQFNSESNSFRLLSIDFRDLP